MSQQTKTDNGNLQAKLALRRYFLDKYHQGEPIRVMDCCSGSGVMWGTLRRDYELESYWAIDLKPKKGRMKIDSSRVLAQHGWRENVIDIDTYGSPWTHWANLLETVDHEVSVFLTVGQVMMGISNEVLRAVGLESLKLPASIKSRLVDFSLSYLLTKGCDNGIKIIEAAEAPVNRGSARCFGVRLCKTAAG